MIPCDYCEMGYEFDDRCFCSECGNTVCPSCIEECRDPYSLDPADTINVCKECLRRQNLTTEEE